MDGNDADGSRGRSPHQKTSEPPDVGCYEKDKDGNPPPYVGSYDKAILELRAYQKDVFWDRRAGIVVLHWSRQIGKSFVLAAWAVHRLCTRPGRLVTVLSNSRENGAEFLLKCAEVCRLRVTRYEMEGMPPVDFEDMRMELRIRKRGKIGRIKVLAANPRTARGFSGDLILDEFAFHEDSDAIWEAAEPILASNKDFLCRIASTGNGRHNLFFRMVEGDKIQNEKLKVKNSEEGGNGRHLSPALVPTTASRGEGGGCIVGGGERLENAGAAGESGVAAAGPADTGALRGLEDAAGKPPEPADKNVCPTDKVASPAADLPFYVEECSDGKFRRVYVQPRPKREKLELKMTYSYEKGPRYEIVYPSKNKKLERKNSEEGNEEAPLPGPVASQARHESVAPQGTCAPRNVVPTTASRGEGGGCVVGDGGSAGNAAATGSSGGGNGKISEPPHVDCYGKDGAGNPPPGVGSYYKSKAGFWVSRVTRTMAHGMGLEIYDSHTRKSISPEQARAQALDKRAYDQNYECSFEDEALALLSHELISAAECDDAGEICEQDWSASAWERIRQCAGPIYAGLDVGRKVDMSVLTVLEKLDGVFWVRGMLRMRDMRLPDQELRLGQLCKLRQLRVVCIDMTGLGLGLFEFAHRNICAHRICGINFASSVSATQVILDEGSPRKTVRVPEALAMEVLRAYEDRKIRQPRDWELREDLRKPGKVTTPGGRVSIAAVRDVGGHADHFWSLALAIEAAGGARVPFGMQVLKLGYRSDGLTV